MRFKLTVLLMVLLIASAPIYGNDGLVGYGSNELAVQRVNGVELATIRGPYAGLYPWAYFPEQAPYIPIPELFDSYQRQSVSQIQNQEVLLNASGFGLDVLQYDPSPESYDPTHWKMSYFPYTSRPFFVLYEHIHNSGYIPPTDIGSKNMNRPENRLTFMRDMEFLFQEVIWPNERRYAVVGGRAIVYMWSSIQMTGDFAGLLDEARQKYPVFFIGSGEDMSNIERVAMFDGIMEYSLAGLGNLQSRAPSYRRMTIEYGRYAKISRRTLDKIESQMGKKILLVPTFQAAYDDTLVVPARDNNPLYSRSRAEVVEHARLIKLSMTRWRIFDNLGPFVIWSELPEGASVLPTMPSQELPGRYVGYGAERLNIVVECFVKRGRIC